MGRPGRITRVARGACAVFVAVLPLFSVATVSAGDPLSDAQIIRNFDVIALRNEHAPVPNPRLAKWRRPIQVHIRNDAPIAPGIRAYTVLHLGRLRAITGHPVTFVERPADANFVVIFTSEERFPHVILRNLDQNQWSLFGRLASARCLGLFRRDPKTNEIVQAVAIIPVDRADTRGTLKACIVEETTQIMGLPNDSSEISSSIFNDNARLDDLSAHDVLLLRLLYDPRMKAGMNRGEALETARRILPELRARAGR